MTKFVKTLSWITLENLINGFIQLISIIYVSKFLNPREFGLVGIVTIFIAIGNMLVDSGMGASLVRKESVDIKQYYTLFIYNFATSFVLYLMLFFIANPIAVYYNSFELSKLIRINSLIIIVNSFSIVQSIILIKNLNFKIICIASISGNLIGFFVCVYLLNNDFGVLSVVYQQITSAIVRLLILYYHVRFKPRLSFDVFFFKEQFRFGFPLFISNICNTINNNISYAIIGKFTSLKTTGYYVQAQKLQQFPSTFISNILDRGLYPIFSKDLKNVFNNSQRIFSIIYFILFPLVCIFSLSSKEIVMLLLGEKWIFSYKILSILFFNIIGVVLQLMIRSILKCYGATRVISLIEFVKLGLVTMVLLVLIKINLIAAIVGLVSVSFIFSIVYYFTVYVLTKKNYLGHYGDILKPALVSVIIYIAIFCFKTKYLFGLNSYITLVFVWVVYFILYVLFMCLIKDFRIKIITAKLNETFSRVF